MKFKLELTINKSRADVWKMFDNPENMKNWQTSLINIETMSGITGQPGAITKLTYEEGKRQFSLIETVTHREEPKRYDVVYENEFTDNPVKNIFVETDDNKTLWTVEAEFKFKTISMKLLGPLLKKRLVARTQRDMDRFREFAESLQEV